jgi:molecular chaperone HtpG
MANTAERHEFNAEVKQLLDIVVHSLYSNKDVFLRELISNASDALDKLRFRGLTESDILPSDDLHIRLAVDKSVRTLSISDNGIGMSRSEAIDNLGTIAKSGTAEFLRVVRESREQRLAPELIGQFGVGFYASFMVADRVTVVTRKAGETDATLWESAGEGSYMVSPAERETPGTTVTLHLKTVDAEDGIEDYTDEWVIKRIVKRYSDFVAYPIRMKSEPPPLERDAAGKPRDAVSSPPGDETINSMKAIWTRAPEEVTDEEHKEFYKHITHDWQDPLERVYVKMEGAVEARALLYIPSQAPFDIYHHEMSYRGLQLYVRRVFIMDECRDLMPPHFRFIKGVVDAEDLSLNVSRELLQQDRQIRAIRRFLVRKLNDTLQKLMRNRLDDYRLFWRQFGPVLKEGLLAPEESTESLLGLVLTYSSHDPAQLTSLEEYVTRMPEQQKSIYYLTGPTIETVRHSPQTEAFLAKGYEVLFFADPVDEIWLRHAPDFEGKRWQSVGRGAAAMGTDEERQAAEAKLQEQARDHASLLKAMYEQLKEQVKEVRLTNRLTSSPACLVGEQDDLPPQLLEMLRRAGQDVPEVKRVLELNPDHPVTQRLFERFERDHDAEAVGDYAALLYGQAVLSEGGQLKDPAEFSRRLASLMERAI